MNHEIEYIITEKAYDTVKCLLHKGKSVEANMLIHSWMNLTIQEANKKLGYSIPAVMTWRCPTNSVKITLLPREGKEDENTRIAKLLESLPTLGVKCRKKH